MQPFGIKMRCVNVRMRYEFICNRTNKEGVTYLKKIEKNLYSM